MAKIHIPWFHPPPTELDFLRVDRGPVLKKVMDELVACSTAETWSHLEQSGSGAGREVGGAKGATWANGTEVRKTQFGQW